mmetsp:Transcript_25760/g.65474  ORF Transcript_25760/g.65474 Transcript_25760/m.65474 type:complete len:244 (+) Transcript_25760:1609-2340(+)
MEGSQGSRLLPVQTCLLVPPPADLLLQHCTCDPVHGPTAFLGRQPANCEPFGFLQPIPRRVSILVGEFAGQFLRLFVHSRRPEQSQQSALARTAGILGVRVDSLGRPLRGALVGEDGEAAKLGYGRHGRAIQCPLRASERSCLRHHGTVDGRRRGELLHRGEVRLRLGAAARSLYGESCRVGWLPVCRLLRFVPHVARDQLYLRGLAADPALLQARVRRAHIARSHASGRHRLRPLQRCTSGK